LFKLLSLDLGPFDDKKEKLWEQCRIDLENESSANWDNLTKEIQKKLDLMKRAIYDGIKGIDQQLLKAEILSLLNKLKICSKSLR